jgi:ParB family transcriptional regulator, chromosome partitioning protein
VSSPRRIGLPQTIRMRHDTHFVDQLTRPSGEAIGRMVPIEDLQPNPRQPRQDLGDLSELKASIREKGLLEPILVRAVGGRYEIIAGERRYRAALEAGLAELPCIVRNTTDAEMTELALVENLQRKDLSAFEEADGLRMLVDSWGYTHDMVAEKLGKSRTSVTETLSLAAMPEEVRRACRRADLHSKSLLLQVVRESEPGKMVALIERLCREGGTRSDARRIAREDRPSRGRPRNFVFRYQPREKSFSLSLQFRKTQVRREEIIEALEAVLEELRQSEEM